MPLVTGSVKHIDADPNDLEWDFRGISGVAFESAIQAFVRRYLNERFPSSRALDTRPSGDGGKDMIVYIPSRIELFGIQLEVPRDKSRALIYIECKKIDKKTLSPNDFGGSLTQLETGGQAPDYFILVTNGTLTPATLHNSKQKYQTFGCRFLLVDRHRLARALQGSPLPWIPPLPNLMAPPPVAVSYSVQYNDGPEPLLDDDLEDAEDTSYRLKKLSLFIGLQNYTDVERVVRVSLHSDVNWDLTGTTLNETGDGEGLNVYIPPNGFDTVKLGLAQRSLEAPDELRINVDVDGRPRALQVDARQAAFEFDPPLFGAEHRASVQTLTDALCGQSPKRLVNLHGRAGAGKSKILKEVRERIAGRNVLMYSVEIRAKKQGRALAQLVRAFHRKLGIREPLGTHITPDEFLAALHRLPPFQYHYCAVIEDVHHASDTLFDALRTFTRSESGGITVIVTGRDDDTFQNDKYFSFIDWMSTKDQDDETGEAGERDDGRLDCHLPPWTDAHCEQFIRVTIDAVPNSVVRRITQLSENTPFGCIQAIEYLLDLDIVKVVNRNTVGIVNAEAIGAKLGLPKGLQHLLDLRADNLAARAGPLARVLLGALAFLGMAVPRRVAEALAEAAEATALAVAIERRFLKNLRDSIRFDHENIQVYFLHALETSAWGREAAHLILSCQAALDELDRYRVGQLRSLCGDHEQAFALMAPLWEQIQGLDNISSTHLEAANRTFLRPLMVSAARIGKPPREIAHLCTIEAYVTLHNAALAVALSTCERQLEELDAIGLDADSKDKYKLELSQLKAHILLNMGHVRSAQKMMQEFAARAMIDARVRGNHKTMFDVYDRLQNIFHQMNHKAMFLHYSDLSKQVAEATGDAKLHALVRSSRVKEHYYDDPLLHLRLTQEATDAARRAATPRHVCHAEINLCVAELLVVGGNEERIHRQIRLLSRQLLVATENAYSFSITRSQVALCAAFCLLGLDNASNRARARTYAEQGIESCLRFGNGFFIWQLHNLMALIELSEPATGRKQVAGHFQTAISYLDRQGLLFLGNLDSCSPNLAVISNWIRFLHEHHGDRDTYGFIGRLSYYDRGRSDLAAQGIERLNEVRENLLIGRNTPLPMPLREPASGYLIAVR